MEFSDVLASSIHDIKNSLSMIINAAEVLADDDEISKENSGQASMLEREARRANNTMIQLLSLYKFENGRQLFQPDEYDVDEFLEELVIENKHAMQARGIDIEYECEEFLASYMDMDLVRGVINSSIGNAERYTDKLIRISASKEDGYVVFRVDDDGPGFPASMQESIEQTEKPGDFESSRTGLGLFFATTVAKAHQAKDKKGFIQMRNKVNLSGGCFELYLPA